MPRTHLPQEQSACGAVAAAPALFPPGDVLPVDGSSTAVKAETRLVLKLPASPASRYWADWPQGCSEA